MLRLDFANYSPAVSSATTQQSAILNGHKLSPTAPRYSTTLKSRCPSRESGLDKAGCQSLTVRTAEDKDMQVEPTPLNVLAPPPPPAAPPSDAINLHLNGRIETPAHLVELTRAMACLPRLQVLSLAYNRLGDKIGTLIGAMGPATLPELHRLVLSGNSLGDLGICALANTLHLDGLPKLTQLDISSNQITTLTPLVRAAESHRDRRLSLEMLNAEHNFTRDESVEAIASAVHQAHLPCLHTLWMGGNELSDRSLQALEGIMRKGSTCNLRTFHLSLNHFTGEAKDALQRSADESVRLVW